MNSKDKGLLSVEFFTEFVIKYFAIVGVILTLILPIIPFVADFIDFEFSDSEHMAWYVSILILYLYMAIVLGIYIRNDITKRRNFNKLFFSYNSSVFEKEATKMFQKCEKSVDYFGASNFLKNKKYKQALDQIISSKRIEFRRYVDILSAENFNKLLSANPKNNRDKDHSNKDELVKFYQQWISKQWNTLQKKHEESIVVGDSTDKDDVLNKADQIFKSLKDQTDNDISELDDLESLMAEILNSRKKEKKDNNFIIDLRVAPSWKWGVHVIVIDKRDTIFSFNDGDGNIGMILRNNTSFAKAICQSFEDMVKNYQDKKELTGLTIEELKKKKIE